MMIHRHQLTVVSIASIAAPEFTGLLLFTESTPITLVVVTCVASYLPGVRVTRISSTTTSSWKDYGTNSYKQSQ
jgi:hypothetical protein